MRKKKTKARIRFCSADNGEVSTAAIVIFNASRGATGKILTFARVHSELLLFFLESPRESVRLGHSSESQSRGSCLSRWPPLGHPYPRLVR